VAGLLTFRLGLAFAALTGFVLMFTPLLGVHGVESALALGLVLPPWIAATAAAYAVRNRGMRGVDLMWRSMGMGLLLWAAPTALLALNALRVRQCAAGEGLAFMLLGPALGCALAASAGVWTAALVRRPRLSVALAALVPIGAALFGLWTFYATPTVYVFGAFGGYFPGAIYDDLVRIPTRYLTYRATTLVALVGLTLLFDALWDGESERICWTGALGKTIVGASALAIVGAVYAQGPKLGHWVSDSSLSEQLGKTVESSRCVLHLPRETRNEDAQRLLADCDFQVERARRLSGASADQPITAYFFRSQREKKRVIGIGRTLIAKPWRREIYLQIDGWPDPVLGHEVVHAVLGELGRGPFAVAGTFGGLIPNPGIIEGSAVALAWDVRDGLDPDQWSRIMKDRGELPDAARLMSVRFSSMPARHAYMSAGSLLRFMMATRGEASLRRAYGSGRIDGLEELEKAWHRYLETVPVTERERGVAEVALARPSIFTAVCPHELARLRADLRGDSAARDDERILETCDEILSIDDGEAQARAARVGALARMGERARALAEIDALREAMNAPKPVVARALEAFADAAWTLDDYDEAKRVYTELLALPRTDGPARQSEVKRIAVSTRPEQRERFYQMLVDGVASPVAVHLAREIGGLRTDGLGLYLEGRQVWAQREFALALPLLERAQSRGLPTPRLMRELQRMVGVAAFALGRYDQSLAAWNARATSSRAAEAVSQQWRERISFASTGGFSPRLGPSSARQAAP
jgi:tetratricopeptide (TPR) repeat protein